MYCITYKYSRILKLILLNSIRHYDSLWLISLGHIVLSSVVVNRSHSDNETIQINIHVPKLLADVNVL